MKSSKTFLKHSVIFSALLASSAAMAGTQEGDILVRARLINIAPGDTGVAGLDVESKMALDVDFTYMMSSNFGIELLLDTSSTHRITSGGNDVATARVLPPALIAQYHISPASNVRPYVGAGINYTLFLSEEAVAVDSIELDDSFGLVVQAGVDVDINSDWYFNADIKYIDMTTEASVNGGSGFDVDINPTVIGFGVGTKF